MPMTTIQRKKILQRMIVIEHDIAELQRARMKVALDGVASASLSSTGGSKSFTKLDLNQIQSLIDDLRKEFNELMDIYETGKRDGWKHVIQVWS